MILLIAVLGIAIATAILKDRTFDAPYPELKATTDSATIARGKYLAMGPAHCADCHANITDYKKVEAGIEVPLTGGFAFKIPPGTIRARNITPDKETGIGAFTDQQIARSLRYGVGFDGRALFDFMPFHNTSDEDMVAILSYLRSTTPVHNPVPGNEYSILGNILRAFAIKPTGPSMEVPKTVARDSSAAYGKYLAYSVANCRGCHTDRDLKTGAFIGDEYAGGFKMESPMDPRYTLTTPNLTPDPSTGRIYGWSQEKFLQRFREGKKIPQSPMPWGPFSRMEESDLIAIYKYLQTLAPVKHEMKDMIVVKD